jgi:hypothetical protein
MAAQIRSRGRNLLKIAAIAGATFADGLILPSAFASPDDYSTRNDLAQFTPRWWR